MKELLESTLGGRAFPSNVRSFFYDVSSRSSLQAAQEGSSYHLAIKYHLHSLLHEVETKSHT